MASLFQDEFLNGLGTWALGYIPYGGADFGEVVAVADAVGDGGEDAFFTEWVVAGDRHIAAAEAARTGNHEMTARDHYLRAAVAYGTAYHPFFGSPPPSKLASSSVRPRPRNSRSRSTGSNCPASSSPPPAAPTKPGP